MSQLRRRTQILWTVAIVLAMAALACGPTGTGGEAEVTAEVPATGEQPAGAAAPAEPQTAESKAAEDAAGAGEQPTEQAGGGGGPGYNDFQTALLNAIINRDYAAMQSMMGNPFTIAGWRSEGRALPPAQAIEELRVTYLPPTGYVYYELNEDLASLLDGSDPLTMWGTSVEAVGAVRFTGWGTDGNTEAIIIIARRPDGSYYWHAVLLAVGGFVSAPPSGGDSGGGDSGASAGGGSADVPDMTDLAAVEAFLKGALANQPSLDLSSEALKAVMTDSFLVTGLVEGGVETPAKAVEFIRQSLPASGAATFSTPDDKVVQWLSDPDEFSAALSGLVADADSRILTSGWAPGGKGEAILLIQKGGGGKYRFAGYVSTPTSFANELLQHDLDAFLADFRKALLNHNYDKLTGMMDGGLEIVGEAEGLYPQNVAAQKLKDKYLLASSTITEESLDARLLYASGTWQYTYSDLLGYEVSACCGSGVKVVAAKHIGGWGPDGTGEAILIVIQKTQGGNFKWYGFIEGPF